MNIARCNKCRHLMSETWKDRTECEKCGSSVEHIKEDLGFMDRAPKLFNGGGIALIFFAVSYLLYKILSGGMGKSEGTSVMILFFSGVIMFAISILIQLNLSTRAKEAILERGEQRPKRSLRRGPSRREDQIQSGRMKPEHPKRGTKVLVSRK